MRKNWGLKIEDENGLKTDWSWIDEDWLRKKLSGQIEDRIEDRLIMDCNRLRTDWREGRREIKMDWW